MDLQIVSTTVSRANQTAVPSLVRKILKVKKGDKLIWSINKNTKAVQVKTQIKDLGTYMSGLGKDIWEGVDVEEYIREGRQDRKFE